MYVIFPADEVVYLSYGRVIYVPQASKVEQAVGSTTKETSSSHHSIRSHTSAPSLPSTSTGSSRSTVRSSIGTFFHNGFASDNGSENDTLQRTKSSKSKRSKDSKDSDKSSKEEKPIRPQRRKKSNEASSNQDASTNKTKESLSHKESFNNKDSCNTGEVLNSKSKETLKSKDLAKSQYLRVPNDSVTNSPHSGRRLSYSDFLPHNRERLNASPKRDNCKLTKKESKRSSPGVDFDDLFNAQRTNSATSLSRLAVESPATGETSTSLTVFSDFEFSLIH